jgi:PIN domain nuclease of toxin-antitoxin system
MTLLLDTHVLLWWWSEPEKLPPRVRALVTDRRNRILVSSATAWEISTKHRIGKYPEGGRVVEEWGERVQTDGFQELPVLWSHALKAGALPGDHRDPFDRMLAAQSILESVPIASGDVVLSAFGAERIWN